MNKKYEKRVVVHETNTAEIIGRVVVPFVKNHTINHKPYYRGLVATERLSGVKDVIPVIVEGSELVKELKIGDTVHILGKFCSHTKKQGEKRKLDLYVSAEFISIESYDTEHVNEVHICGHMVSKRELRRTTKGLAICDFILRNTDGRRNSFIPSIVWRENAEVMAEKEIGYPLELYGRIKSREYKKYNHDGESELGIAYELECTECYQYVEGDGYDIM